MCNHTMSTALLIAAASLSTDMHVHASSVLLVCCFPRTLFPGVWTFAYVLHGDVVSCVRFDVRVGVGRVVCYLCLTHRCCALLGLVVLFSPASCLKVDGILTLFHKCWDNGWLVCTPCYAVGCWANTTHVPLSRSMPHSLTISCFAALGMSCHAKGSRAGT